MRASKLVSAAVFMVAVFSLSFGYAFAGGPGGGNAWTVKVTGGGDAAAGPTEFSLTMSASDVGGQFQYTRDNLVMHGTIDCVYVAEDESYTVMTGVVTHAAVPLAPFVDGATIGIAVKEGGKGSGDQVRIWNVAPAHDCETEGPSYPGPYPGTYYDGNVTIRTR